MPDKPFNKRLGSVIAIAGIFAALAAGVAVSFSPALGLLLLAAALAGVALIVLPPDRMAAGCLVIATVCAVLAPVNATTGLLAIGPLSGLSTLAFICMSLAAMVFLRSGPGPLLRGGRITLFAAVFFMLFMFVSFVNGFSDSQTFLAQWIIWASAFVLAVCTSGRLVPAVIAAWISIGFLGGAYAIYEFLARPETLYAGYLAADAYRGVMAFGAGAGLPRAQATFGHPIPLGTFLVTTAVLAMWAVRFPPGRHLGALRVLVLAVMLSGAVLTFSRSSWVAFFVAVGIGLAMRRASGLDRLRTAALFIVPVVVLLQTPLGDNIVSYVTGIEQTLSFQGRAASLESMPQILGAGLMPALLGSGGGSQQEIYQTLGIQAYQGLQIIDNQYITLLIQVGVVGLGAFLAMAWSALSSALRRSSRLLDSPDAGLISGVGFALLAAFTAILFYDGLAWPSTAILVWGLLGFLARYNGEVLTSPRGAVERAAKEESAYHKNGRVVLEKS